MPIQTVSRSWTIATWLVAGHDDRIELLDRAIENVSADAVLLQSIRQADVRELAAVLGFHHTWALSHHPRSRLLRGSGVGLAVLTPHRIAAASDTVVGEHRSAWSKHRRIAQTATVVRSDHSAYQFSHAVASAPMSTSQPGGPPPVSVYPARIDSDPSQAIELPDSATVVSLATQRSIPGVAQLLTVTFEMPWVQGDFPVE